MAHAHHIGSHPRRNARARSPLAGPLMLFAGACAVAVLYVAYVLWPRWPDAAVTLNAPSMPIVIAGTAFNIEPAAIRIPMQRRPGNQERVDLAYLWPSLSPPDPSQKIVHGAPVDPNERLFVTIKSGDESLPPLERVQTIYPRYLVAEPALGPDGLTLRAFRDNTPYAGEDLIFDPANPEHFLARCSRKGVGNSGVCLYEQRIGNADVTMRFPRDWLNDWRGVQENLDRLRNRLRPH